MKITTARNWWSTVENRQLPDAIRISYLSLYRGDWGIFMQSRTYAAASLCRQLGCRRRYTWQGPRVRQHISIVLGCLVTGLAWNPARWLEAKMPKTESEKGVRRRSKIAPRAAQTFFVSKVSLC